MTAVLGLWLFTAPMGLYLALTATSAWSLRPLLWGATWLGVVASHFWYGVRFAQGLCWCVAVLERAIDFAPVRCSEEGKGSGGCAGEGLPPAGRENENFVALVEASENVRGAQHCPALVGDSAEQRHDALFRGRVKSGRRLVEKEDIAFLL